MNSAPVFAVSGRTVLDLSRLSAPVYLPLGLPQALTPLFAHLPTSTVKRWLHLPRYSKRDQSVAIMGDWRSSFGRAMWPVISANNLDLMAPRRKVKRSWLLPAGHNPRQTLPCVVRRFYYKSDSTRRTEQYPILLATNENFHDGRGMIFRFVHHDSPVLFFIYSLVDGFNSRGWRLSDRCPKKRTFDRQVGRISLSCGNPGVPVEAHSD